MLIVDRPHMCTCATLRDLPHVRHGMISQHVANRIGLLHPGWVTVLMVIDVSCAAQYCTIFVHEIDPSRLLACEVCLIVHILMHRRVATIRVSNSMDTWTTTKGVHEILDNRV